MYAFSLGSFFIYKKEKENERKSIIYFRISINGSS